MQDVAALKLVSHPDRKLVRVVTVLGSRDRVYVDLNGEQLDELIATLSVHRRRLLP